MSPPRPVPPPEASLGFGASGLAPSSEVDVSDGLRRLQEVAGTFAEIVIAVHTVR